MRAFRWSGFVVLACLLFSPGLAADEGERHDAAQAAEKALEALKLRMEARIKEGELLSRTGRLEEALEAYRSVGRMYDEGMQSVRDLVARLTGGAAPVPRRRLGMAPAPRRPVPRDQPFESGALTGKAAVERALRWLAAHQSPNGGWEAAGFNQWCDGKPILDASKRPDGLGKALYDPGVSGLALLAFLGAGYTHQGKHPYAKVVSRGLRYLKNIQDAEGCFGPRSNQQYVYSHAVCSLAMVEAFGMTQSPIFRGSAQRALDFIASARNPYMGWRYGIRPGDNDTSVTTWMVMCLASAKKTIEAAVKRDQPAPLTIDEAAFVGARAWLDKVTDPDYGRVGYIQRGGGSARPQSLVDRFPADKSEAMTAAGIVARILMGDDPRRSPLIRKGAELCLRLPPVWNLTDGSIDMYYWYHGTLAMYQVGGKHWQAWAQALEDAVVKTQRRDGDACGYQGSWDPVGPWGLDGGRVFSTALMCLVLEVDQRYGKATARR